MRVLYYAGWTIPDGDKLFSDILTVIEGNRILALRPSGTWIGHDLFEKKNELSPEETAEYLWRRFVEPLEWRNR